ncbi:MAG TPA: hypothetical protein VFX60_17410 [Micromonospora sp.]|nr:hypothetical protein [Micromonospora sp.]
MPQPLVSKHRRVLREAKAVAAPVVGNRRVYRLTAEPLPDVVYWVRPYHQMRARSFDRLAEALERKEDQ